MTRFAPGRPLKRGPQRHRLNRIGGTVRLWTPWRMRYVGGGAKEEGCIFCNRLRSDDDVSSLIVWRGQHTFAILNLFPYNTGHLMLVPNVHVDSPETAPEAALAELALALRPTLRALRRVLGCHGFNVGFNVGAVAGAGVAEHLHQHVVPRWTGDANFMPILASTMVMPELIPITYAKIRAEFERELAKDAALAPTSGTAGDPGAVSAVVLSPGRDAVLLEEGDNGLRLPSAVAGADEAIWRAAMRAVGFVPGGVDLAGWAGPRRADAREAPALTLVARDATASAPLPGTTRWLPVDRLSDRAVTPAARLATERALAQLATNSAP